MNFVLSEEQTMLQKSAADFVKRESSLQRIRALREDAVGYTPALWQQMGELGWLGIPFAEEQGGLGQGVVDVCCVMEELGRGLCPEPFLSSVLLGGLAVSKGGDAAQQAAWLPRLIEGEVRLTLAYQEKQGRFEPFDVCTRARLEGDQWVLQGEKTFVLNAERADALVVTARIEGKQRDVEGLGLFVVPRETAGLQLDAIPSMDTRQRSVVRLADVRVPATSQLRARPSEDVLREVLSAATVGLCAEMLGGMTAAFEMTQDYLKTRKQFGVPIGSFQALKHRSVDEYVQLELARSAVYYAAMALDENQSDAMSAVSTAKARCNDAYRLIGNESLQMHGGIGMTDEHDIGFFFKHGRVAEVTLGDSAYHRDLFARLREY